MAYKCPVCLSKTSFVYLPLEFHTIIPSACLSNFTLNVNTAPWVKCLNRFRIWTICSYIEPQLAWCSPLSPFPSAMNKDSRGLHTDKSHRHTTLTSGKPIAYFASYYHLPNTLRDISNCAWTVYLLSSAGWWCCFCNQVAKQQQCVPHTTLAFRVIALEFSERLDSFNY